MEFNLLTKESETDRIIVRNMMGYTLFESAISQQKQLVMHFEELQPGVYVVIFRSGKNERVYTVKKI